MFEFSEQYIAMVDGIVEGNFDVGPDSGALSLPPPALVTPSTATLAGWAFWGGGC